MVREFVTTSDEAVEKAVAVGAMLRARCRRSNAVVGIVLYCIVLVIGYKQSLERSYMQGCVCVLFSSLSFSRLDNVERVE